MIWRTIRKLIVANPMGIFIYTILTKWYLLIAVAGVVVTFWVFKGLEEAGVLQSAWNIVEKAVNESKAVAKYCIPKITNPSSFWNCLENTPEYTPTKEENILSEQLKDATSVKQPDNVKNPYDD